MSDVVCIFGSRDYPYLDSIKTAVYRLPQSTIVVVGGARGVDQAAEAYALARGLTVELYRADWNKGLSAGFKRNALMVERADRGIGFWYNRSRGSKDTVERFNTAGKPVEVYEIVGSEPAVYHENLVLNRP